MKLKYNSRRTVTTSDLFDACDPPLIFEVRTRPPREWARLNQEFESDNCRDADLARSLIALAFLTVSDGENTYPITSPDEVDQLRQAIEETNPGYGNDFLTTIAWGFSTNHYTYLGDHLGNSLKPLSPSNDNGREKKEVLVS